MDLRSFGKVNSVVRPPTALSRVHFVRVLERVAGRQVQDRLREQLRQPADHVADRHHADRAMASSTVAVGARQIGSAGPSVAMVSSSRAPRTSCNSSSMSWARSSNSVMTAPPHYKLARRRSFHRSPRPSNGLRLARPSIISPLASAAERPAARTALDAFTAPLGRRTACGPHGHPSFHPSPPPPNGPRPPPPRSFHPPPPPP